MTASVAHTSHSRDPFLHTRAELAEQAFEHTQFTLELLGRFATRTAARIGQAVKRWSEVHRQAAQDRIFWELALTDPRLMQEIQAMEARQEAAAPDRTIG